MGIIKDRAINKIEKNLAFNVGDLELSIAELKFISELCTRGFDYGAAHEKAGYVCENKVDHKIEGRKLAAKPNVAEAIQRFLDVAIGPYIETLQYEALEALRGMATWKPEDFFNPDGSPKSLNEIPEDKLYAIDGIEDRYYGKDANRKVKVFKLTDRKQAWKMLLDLKKTELSKKKTSDPDKEDKLKKIFDGILTGKTKMKVSERMRSVEMEGKEEIVQDDPDTEGDDDGREHDTGYNSEE